jgi:hypothetical protein
MVPLAETKLSSKYAKHLSFEIFFFSGGTVALQEDVFSLPLRYPS